MRRRWTRCGAAAAEGVIARPPDAERPPGAAARTEGGVQVDLCCRQDTQLRAPWWQVVVAAAACAGISVACFSNAFDAEFVFDDNGAIVENPDVVGDGELWDKLGDMAAHDYWGNEMRVSSHKSYRPLTVFSFRLNWLQAGKRLESYVFHGTNVYLHAAVTGLLVVVVRLYRLVPLGAYSGTLGAATETGVLLVMGVLFAVHPVHCEAVTGLVGRADVLASLFVLLALLAYYPAAASKAHGPVAAGVVGGVSVVAAVGLIVCATLCKETGLTGLALLGLMDACVNEVNVLAVLFASNPGDQARKSTGCAIRDAHTEAWVLESPGAPPDVKRALAPEAQPPQGSAAHAASGLEGGEEAANAAGAAKAGNEVEAAEHGHSWRAHGRVHALQDQQMHAQQECSMRVVRPWRYWGRMAALLVAGGGILCQRLRMQEGSKPEFTAHNNPAAFTGDIWARYMTYWHYYSINAQLLVWPYPLCCDWSMGAVAVVSSWQDTRNLASLLLLAVLSFWAACVVHGCLARWRRPWSRVVALAGALTLAPLLPASNLFFPVGFVVAERILYLPSAGPALLVACLLRRVLSSRVLRCAVVMGISLALAARTRGRNHEWRSSEALFAAGVVALPNNAKLHYNLAHVTCKGVSQALTQAQNAHTAKAKRALKKWKRCRKLYEEAVRLAPDFQEAHGALGSLVVDSDLQLGLEHLEVALALDPHSKIAQKNIGDALGRKQVDIPRAKLHLENAIRLDPTWADAHNNLGNTLLAFNDMAKVREAYENALRFDPAHPNALENMHKFFWSQEGLPEQATGVRGGRGGKLGASASAPSHGKGARPKDGGTGEGGKTMQDGKINQAAAKTIHHLPSAPPNDFAHRAWGAAPDAPSSKPTPESSQPTATPTKAPRKEDKVKQAPAQAGTRQHPPAAGSHPHAPRVAGGEREGDDRQKGRHKGRHKEPATDDKEPATHTNKPSPHKARLNGGLVQQTSKAQGKGAKGAVPNTQLPPASTQRPRGTHGADTWQDTPGKTMETLPQAQMTEAKMEGKKMEGKKMEGKKMEAWAESDYRSALETCHRGGGAADSRDPLDTRDNLDARVKSCSPAYRRHILNNLGVLLVQRAASLASASGGVEDGREDARELLRESMGLFNHALSLKRAWAEAQHNLAQASQALERLRP